MEPQSVHGHSSRMTAKQTREPVSLLDLPDELLVQVIDELDGIDLYTLSVQCKRLQRLSLPLYLQSLGIATPLIFPMDQLVISQQQLYVHGFPLAFFGKTVRRLSCEFMPGSRGTTSALQRLHRIIINIQGLEDVALYFNQCYFKTFGTWGSLTEACIHLLTALTERCARLTLSHANSYESVAYKKELVEKEAIKWRRGRSLLKDPFKALGKRFSREISRSRSPHVPATYPPFSRALKTLSFQSSRFLLPPFTGWALNVLNTAPLTRLDLVDDLQSQTSALIFGALTIPTLEHLCIISYRSASNFDAHAEFLSRHDTISTFDILSHPSSVHPLPITTLPALVSLRSNLSDIGHLLAPTGAFPKLAHIRVVIHPSPSNRFVFSAVEASLEPTAQRLATPNFRLCLDVLPVSHRDDWVNLATLPNDLENYPVLSRVREIAITFFRPNIVLTSAIPTWLSKFPMLEHIELSRMPTTPGYGDNMFFLRSIAQKCAGVRTAKIGDETRDISVWLSSNDVDSDYHAQASSE